MDERLEAVLDNATDQMRAAEGCNCEVTAMLVGQILTPMGMVAQVAHKHEPNCVVNQRTLAQWN